LIALPDGRPSERAAGQAIDRENFVKKIEVEENGNAEHA
jgi:hypothetical protein